MLKWFLIAILLFSPTMQQRWRTRAGRASNFYFYLVFLFLSSRRHQFSRDFCSCVDIMSSSAPSQFVCCYVVYFDRFVPHPFIFFALLFTGSLCCHFTWITWKDFVYTSVILFGNRNRFECEIYRYSNICRVIVESTLSTSNTILYAFMPHSRPGRCYNRHSNEIKEITLAPTATTTTPKTTTTTTS